MFCITRNDVRLICFGRTVGCTDPTADSHPIVAALVRLKGPRIIPAYQTKRFRRFVRNWTEMVSRQLLRTLGFRQSALQTATDICASFALPKDIAAISLDAKSPPEDLQKLAYVA